MSLINTFVNAFKKASAPKEPSTLEQVRNAGGLGVSAPTDAFDPPPGGAEAPGGIPNIPNPGPGPQAPQPLPPKDSGDQGPIEGGDSSPTDGDGPSTPPSEPFDPDQIDFGRVGATGGGGLRFEDANKIEGINISLTSSDPEEGGELDLGNRADLFDANKIEGIDIAVASSDPEEGGEFDPSRANIDDAFIRRMRFVDDGAASEPAEALEFREPRPEEREGRLLTQIGETPDAPEDEGEEDAPPPDDSDGEGTRLSLLQRGHGGTSADLGPRDGTDAFDVKIEDLVRTGRASDQSGLKFEDANKFEGVDIAVASSDPEEGGEIATGSPVRLDEGFVQRLETIGDARAPLEGEQEFADGSDTPQRSIRTQMVGEEDGEPSEGGGRLWGNPDGQDEDGSDSEGEAFALRTPRGSALAQPGPGSEFDVKIEELVRTSSEVPAAPGGVPLPYPADGGADLAGELARKAGKVQQDYLEVKMEDVLVSSRESGQGTEGEQPAHDTGPSFGFGRRPEVRDSHDRFANVDHEGQKVQGELDDDLESSSLLELKPAPAGAAMLPGLGGQVPDDVDLLDDVGADADADAPDGDL